MQEEITLRIVVNDTEIDDTQPVYNIYNLMENKEEFVKPTMGVW
jgi:hypothetical protein